MSAIRKSVLITGCSRGGIGDGLAQLFQEKGYQVFATVRNPAKISPTLSNSSNVSVLTLDVLSEESISAAVESVKRVTGDRLDVLVNNSAGNMVLPALDISIPEAKKVFDVNFWAPLAMIQAFAPLLIKAKGCIVNNTSASAHLPMAFMSIYNASKAALLSGSETWRHELAPLGVRTISLVTTGVKTNFFDNYQEEKVPEASHYYDVQDLIHEISTGSLQKNAISTRQYSNKVVREIEKGSVGPVWAGTDAFFARLGVWLSPQSIFDKITESMVPISGRMAQAAQKKKD